jgi:hypothetical protein
MVVETPDAEDDRVASRADHLLPEETAASSEDANGQAEAILAESDDRSEDRAAPGSFVEHRTSDEATEPSN